MDEIDKAMRKMGDTLALNLDNELLAKEKADKFELWYVALEEHYKRGIEGIVRDKVMAMKPRYIPVWLWRKWTS